MFRLKAAASSTRMRSSSASLVDNYNQHVAGSHGFLDRLNEILTMSHAIEVHENFVLRKVL